MLDKDSLEQVLFEIAEIRRSGWCNMYSVEAVINALYELGCDYTAEFISENKEYYLETLLPESAKY